MVRHDAQSDKGAGSPAGARFGWSTLLLWLPISSLLSVGLTWLAVIVAEHFAPLLVFPILVGLMLGVTLIGLARLMQVGNRATIVSGTILACLVAIIGQHYVCYHVDRELLQDQAKSFHQAKLKHPDLVLGTAPKPPRGLFDYLRRQAHEGRPLLASYVVRGALAWTSWIADGLLLAAAAFLVVLPAAGQPYCGRCRSWFRTTRRGKVDADSARRLAGLMQIELPGGIAWMDYRVVSCGGGCDPTGFEVSWVGESGKPVSARVWLGSAQRRRITRALDALKHIDRPPIKNERQTTSN